MNNKIIAAGVVVALCAVALIGVGYAYTATVTSENNTFGSKFITIQAGDNAETVWNNVKFDYNTTTTKTNVVFTSVETEVTGSEVIKVNKRDTSVSTVTLTVTVPRSIFSSNNSSYLGLFYQPAVESEGGTTSDKNATMKLVYDTSTEKSSSFEYNETDGNMVWTFLNVPVEKNLTVKLKCLGGASITVNSEDPTTVTGPTINIAFTFKADAPTLAPAP